MRPTTPLRRHAIDMRVVAALALALGLLALPARQAAACSCAAMDPEGQVAQADLAFIGTPVDRAPIEELPGLAVFTFQVEEPIKGDPGDEVRIRAGGMGASCGMEFALGEPYRVVANANGRGFVTGLCTGNESINGVAPPQPMPAPRVPAAIPADGGLPTGLVIPVIVGAVVLVAGVSALAFRRST